MAGLLQTIPPAAEPLTLAEAKNFLRVDADDTTQDDLIQDLIATARQYVEDTTHQQLVTATWAYTIDRFPYRMPGLTWAYPGDVWDRQNASWLEGLTVRPPRPPLQSLLSISYIDSGGATQTMDLTTVTVDTASFPGRLMPTPFNIWPITRVQFNAATITYTAGYGPSTTIALAISTGAQTVTPVSMSGIYVGTQLDIDTGTSRETVGVTAVTATTFTATFNKAHGAATSVLGAIPKAFRQAMRMMIVWGYEQRSPAPSDWDRVHALLDSRWDGNYF